MTFKGVTHIWNPRSRSVYSLYNFYGAMMTIKGSLQMSISIVEAFSSRNFLSPGKILPKIIVWGKWGTNVKFCFRDPQKA